MKNELQIKLDALGWAEPGDGDCPVKGSYNSILFALLKEIVGVLIKVEEAEGGT